MDESLDLIRLKEADPTAYETLVRSNPSVRISAGYGSTPSGSVLEQREQRALQDRARTWKYDPSMEAALKLKDSDPAGFAALSPAIKMAAAYYSTGKAAASELGLERLQAEAASVGIELVEQSPQEGETT